MGHGEIKRYHPHPITIFRYMWKGLFLLVIPLIRGFLSALRGGITIWLKGAWVDIAVLAAIIVFAILSTINYTIEITEMGLNLKWGIFFLQRRSIPLENICTITSEKNIFLCPLRATLISADTRGGNGRSNDVRIYLMPKAAKQLMHILDERFKQEYAIKRYRPKNLYVLLLAAITSNTFYGIILAATFISQSGKILGRQFSERVFGTFEAVSKALAFGIPPAAAALAYLLLGGWLLTFGINLLQNINFSVTRRGDNLQIKSGVIIKRESIIDATRINYLDIRQTLYTRVSGLSSVFIHTFGYGKESGDVAAIIPAASNRQLMHGLKMLTPDFKRSEIVIRPCRGSLIRFIWQPLAGIGGVIAAAFITDHYFPAWRELTRWLVMMALLPLIWFLMVRLLEHRSSGIGEKDRYLTLRYSKGYHLHTVVIPKEKVAYWRMRESIFQRRVGSCDLLIYSFDEGKKCHHIKNIEKGLALKVMERGKREE